MGSSIQHVPAQTATASIQNPKPISEWTASTPDRANAGGSFYEYRCATASASPGHSSFSFIRPTEAAVDSKPKPAKPNPADCAKPKGQAALKAMDTNKDGVVDCEEFVTAGGTKEEFEQLDVNADGVLDVDELDNLSTKPLAQDSCTDADSKAGSPWYPSLRTVLSVGAVIVLG